MSKLEELKKEGLYRKLSAMRVCGRFLVAEDGSKKLNFASNDYLGLTANVEAQREFLECAAKRTDFLMTSASSRLLAGNFPEYDALEEKIGRAFGKSCLLFNGGYHANTGILPAITTQGDLIVADKLSHASLIDALMLAKAKFVRFAHNDMSHLRKILENTAGRFRRTFIVTEAVFSMDGDTAPLNELVQIKREFGAFLYVDEAHSFGLRGANGLGLCEETGLVDDVDIIMCTLGKALASHGAFVITDTAMRETLINLCRPFIFTTALPPINVMWTDFVFDRLPKMGEARSHIKKISERFRNALGKFRPLGNTQIVPIVAGDEKRALKAAEALAHAGIAASAVRHPTVPKGSARIRFSLTAALGEGDVDFCAELVNGIFAE